MRVSGISLECPSPLILSVIQEPLSRWFMGNGRENPLRWIHIKNGCL